MNPHTGLLITNKDIEYKDGIIRNIKGIDFVNKQIIIERDLYKLENIFEPNIVMDKKLMSDSWDKYLKDIKKYLQYNIVINLLRYFLINDNIILTERKK